MLRISIRWRRCGEISSGQELANRCADDLEELDTAVRSGMARVEDSGKLPFSFLKHVKLFF